MLFRSRTKVRAERVFAALARMGLTSQTIHGDKEQADRSLVMNQFKKGEVKVLIATDISARGIDIANVDYVVNYDLPEQAENYVHRVGRTGRGTQKGNAVSFCSTEEKEILAEIESFLDKPIDVLQISKMEYLETIDFTEDHSNADLKAVLKEIEELQQFKKKKKGKR